MATMKSVTRFFGLPSRQKKKERQSPFVHHEVTPSNLSDLDYDAYAPDPAKGSDNSTLRFTYNDLEEATNGFSETNLLDTESFACIYRGILPNGQSIVVKKCEGDKGNLQFQLEVEVNSKVRHRHVVNLLGYCTMGDRRLLVYNHAPNNALDYHLHRNVCYALKWPTRLKIAIGAARGIACLHEDCGPCIVHRDIKSASIQLDMDFEAQVSELGLAKLLPDAFTSETTVIVGTFGYLDPEYFTTTRITAKSDVYSFGVVLLELLTGKKPIDSSLQNPCLTEWASPILAALGSEEDLHLLADPRLDGIYDSKEMMRMAQAAAACIQSSRQERPTMREVVKALEGGMSLPHVNKGPSVSQSSLLERQYSASSIISVNRTDSDLADDKDAFCNYHGADFPSNTPIAAVEGSYNSPHSYHEQGTFINGPTRSQGQSQLLHAVDPIMTKKALLAPAYMISDNVESPVSKRPPLSHLEKDCLRSDNSPLQLPYADLEAATNGFSETNLLAKQSFAHVYKGIFPEGKEIAVKKFERGCADSDRQFEFEVEVHSRVHHRHVVNLVGYCIMDDHRLLVYNYATNNVLDYHIHRKKGRCALDWPTRLKIAIGAACGIAYLHEDCSPCIIHRNINSANIQLDMDFEAQVSELGLAISTDDFSLDRTLWMDVFAYLGPEYFSNGIMTAKSDVFSFGVVLLEILTGKKAYDWSLAIPSLVEWACPIIAALESEEDLHLLADRCLDGFYDSKEMMQMVQAAAACIQYSPEERPTMGEVVKALEGRMSFVDVNRGLRPGQSSLIERTYSGSSIIRVNSLDSDLADYKDEFCNNHGAGFHSSTPTAAVEGSYNSPHSSHEQGTFINGPTRSHGQTQSLHAIDPLVTKKTHLAPAYMKSDNVESPGSKRPPLSHHETDWLRSDNSMLQFAYNDLEAATNGFSETNLLAVQSFARRYKGILQNGQEIIVKKFERDCADDDRQLQFELEVYSRVHHCHVVNLVGYCIMDDHRLLVYNSATKYVLNYHLYGEPKWGSETKWGRPLDWPTRLKIAIGAARGIAYLHEDCSPSIIHHNVNSTNILLDMDFEAQVSEGLANSTDDPIRLQTLEFSSMFGYMAPERWSTGSSTAKSDVFSFGVVLLELLTGENAKGSMLAIPNLAEWGRSIILALKSEEDLHLLADPCLDGIYDSREMMRMAQAAAACVESSPEKRPSIGQVVEALDGGMSGADVNRCLKFSQNSSDTSTLQFTYDDLAAATNGFSRANIISEGGFGCVYKGVMPNGQKVAVKKFKSSGAEGDRGFQAEVEVSSRVHHRHVVNLVGYCTMDDQRLLVFKYALNNALDYHLHEKGLVLDWTTRLKIAIGAARGIAYLHEECNPCIIHRDIKSANILLDNDFEAQVSELGVANLKLNAFIGVETWTMGRMGYLAPEDMSTGRVTAMSDVFSFGVVLLELLTGKEAIDWSLKEIRLVDWACPILAAVKFEEDLHLLADPSLNGSYDSKEMMRMVETAMACVQNSPQKRPRMGQVVKALEGEMSPADVNRGLSFGQSRSDKSTLQFTYNDLAAATNWFSRANLLQEGEFGCVYKGVLPNRQNVVVKQLKISCVQGEKEFPVVVEVNSRVSHRHVENLVGYCTMEDQRLLVYKYAPTNTLDFHLKTKQWGLALDWPTRLKIAIGSARGLAYLHEECNPCIIHPDIKSANISLDKDFEAQVSGWLATLLPVSCTEENSAPVGTVGYRAPESISTGRITAMSNVFSFGVVLLELLTGKEAIDLSLPEASLVDWACPILAAIKIEEDLHLLADPSLSGIYDSKEMMQMTKAAAACLQNSPQKRPRIGQVVKTLEGEVCLADLDRDLRSSQKNALVGISNSNLQFEYNDLATATNGFSNTNLLGEGGFGCVYKGVLANGHVVAVKELKSSTAQGEKQFRAEVDIISRVHHRNLVNLVGYCEMDNRRLLVYDYAPNNALDCHLHAKKCGPALDWPTRLKIAIGAACGIAYLHDSCHGCILHCDIKSANILLDSNFEAQVSDFGLARLTPGDLTYVTRNFAGTLGYLAPEYVAAGRLTVKSDVFSFGVVLLELLTGKKAIDKSLPGLSLVEWARSILAAAKIEEDLQSLADPSLNGVYDSKEMMQMAEAAAACVNHSPEKRPKMGQVVRALSGEMPLEKLNRDLRLGQINALAGIGKSNLLFTYNDLAVATNGFSNKNLLGEGGFGCVYKGVLANGHIVAVKELRSSTAQGEKQFRVEVDIISRVNHRNLINLVGYCEMDNRRLLVYDYAPNNALNCHLHSKKRGPALDWPTRLKIAIGAARGIAYLHENCHGCIIHCDIKSANILLDSDFEAKVSDFGLAKLTTGDLTYVASNFAGTFGYLAPEYAAAGRLTVKSDVFSFGVVLLELLTGKKAIDDSLPELSLVEWARPILAATKVEKDLRQLADPSLRGFYDSREMMRMAEAAAACVIHSAERRPKMGKVVRALAGKMPPGKLNRDRRPGQSTDYGFRQQRE